MLSKSFITLALAFATGSTLAVPVTLVARHGEENGKLAQQQNVIFGTLDIETSCTATHKVGEKACVNGSVALCSPEDDWELEGRCTGANKACFAVPLEESHGIEVQCATEDAVLAAFKAVGVEGGVTGDGSLPTPGADNGTSEGDDTDAGDDEEECSASELPASTTSSSGAAAPTESTASGDGKEGAGEFKPTSIEGVFDPPAATTTTGSVTTTTEAAAETTEASSENVTVTVTETIRESAAETAVASSTTVSVTTTQNPTEAFLSPTNYFLLPTDPGAILSSTVVSETVSSSSSASPTITLTPTAVASSSASEGTLRFIDVTLLPFPPSESAVSTTEVGVIDAPPTTTESAPSRTPSIPPVNAAPSPTAEAGFRVIGDGVTFIPLDGAANVVASPSAPAADQYSGYY